MNYNDGCQMKLQKVEKLDKNFISLIKIYKRPLTSTIRIRIRILRFQLILLIRRVNSQVRHYRTPQMKGF